VGGGQFVKQHRCWIAEWWLGGSLVEIAVKSSKQTRPTIFLPVLPFACQLATDGSLHLELLPVSASSHHVWRSLGHPHPALSLVGFALLWSQAASPWRVNGSSTARPVPRLWFSGKAALASSSAPANHHQQPTTTPHPANEVPSHGENAHPFHPDHNHNRR
jgi:hypothetical protein